MRFALAACLMLAVVALAAPARAQRTGTIISAVDAIFAPWDETGSPGCALGVVEDGEFIYERGYGFANLDWDIPSATDTVFYVGSVSKQFTAAVIALLAEEGTVDLDENIREYFPEIRRYAQPITVRHLVHHTSGLRDIYTLMSLAGIRLEDVFTDEQAIELIAAQRETNFEPGSEYLYSNSGYFLLAQLVERASGKTLREFAEERIFAPLGMEDTHFHDRPSHIVDRRAISYQDSDVDFDNYIATGHREFQVSYLGNFDKVGAGGLYTTVRDLLLWDRNFYSGDVGGRPFLDLIHTRGALNDGSQLTYAFGLTVDEYRGLKTVSHGGSMMGFKAAYLQFPEQRLSVITTCNLGSINPMPLAQQVADVYLEDQLALALPSRTNVQRSNSSTASDPFSNHELVAFAGTFYSDELDVTYELAVENGQLWLRLRNTPPRLLRKLEDGLARAGTWNLTFEHDVGEIASAFTINAGRVTNIRFKRR
jgi:CubicO group peptidase (beta-lactamase class C family)